MLLPLTAQIESILFIKTEPVSVKWLAEFLNSDEEKIEYALKEFVCCSCKVRAFPRSQ